MYLPWHNNCLGSQEAEQAHNYRLSPRLTLLQVGHVARCEGDADAVEGGGVDLLHSDLACWLLGGCHPVADVKKRDVLSASRLLLGRRPMAFLRRNRPIFMSTAQWRLPRRLVWRLSEAAAVDARMFPTKQQPHLVSASQHLWRSVTDGRLQPVCHKEKRKRARHRTPRSRLVESRLYSIPWSSGWEGPFRGGDRVLTFHIGILTSLVAAS